MNRDIVAAARGPHMVLEVSRPQQIEQLPVGERPIGIDRAGGEWVGAPLAGLRPNRYTG
jgi:hypothetical protein